MGRAGYEIGRFFGKWLYALSIRGRVIRPRLAEREGGYVLACSHMSHLEPFIISTLVRRRIDWMARMEFYRWRITRPLLRTIDAFPVNRFGVPVSAIRAAIARCRAGRVVGIFPEGGVVRGRASVCRGGPIKRGACLVAMRADVPIVPCVLVGAHALTEFYPWVPFRRATVWIAFGQAIPPVHDAPTRKIGREIMARQLSNAFRALYLELLQRYDITEEQKSKVRSQK